MKKKSLLLLVLLLCSCSEESFNTTSPSSETPDISESVSSSSSQENANLLIDDFLEQIQTGYSISGKAFSLTSTGYTNYNLKFRLKEDGYDYVRYTSAENKPCTEDEVFVNYYFTKDLDLEDGYVSEPLLDISNSVEYFPAPIGANDSYVLWSKSAYANPFLDLTVYDFYLKDDVYHIDPKENTKLATSLAEQFIPKNPGRTISSISFDLRDKNALTMEVVFNPFSFYGDYEMTFTGEIVLGDSFTFEEEVKPAEGESIAELEELFSTLQSDNYKLDDVITYETGEEYVRSTISTDGDNLEMTIENASQKNSAFYKKLESGLIQQAMKINGQYYDYLDPIKGDITSLLPSFAISSIFFSYDASKKAYVYDKGAKGENFLYTNVYNVLSDGMAISSMEIQILDSSALFDVTYSYPANLKERILISDIGTNEELANVTSISDCSNLKTSELLSNSYKTLSDLLLIVGGESNLDLIPTLGGKNSLANLYYYDGSSEEGSTEPYYAIEYRVIDGLSAILTFEEKLENAGFVHNAQYESKYGGDVYQISISVGDETKTMSLEVGYTSSTLAIFIDVI